MVWVSFWNTPNLAVGILYFSQIFFVKIFDPSSCEHNLFGPNTFILLFSKKSTKPSTKGFSGPIMTRSIFSLFINFFNNSKLSKSKLIFSAISAVPALPGKQKILDIYFELFKLEQIACSLPPLPIIPTFI